MIIPFNTSLKLYENVPIDSTYKNTVYFAHGAYSAQNAYFNKYLSKTTPNMSYIRERSNSVKVEGKPDNFISVNYLSFENPNALNPQKYYCFVDNIEYVNNNTVRIYFSIDFLQTFMCDITWLDCLIEREHTTSDKFGEHTVDEGLNVGDDLKVNIQHNLMQNDGVAACIVGTRNLALPDFSGQAIVSGARSICRVKSYKLKNGSSIGFNWDLNDYNRDVAKIEQEGYAQYVLGAYFYPAYFGSVELSGVSGGGIYTRHYDNTFKMLSQLDGYKPKNKKCYCYPYNRFRMSFSNEDYKDYALEKLGSSKKEDSNVGVEVLSTPFPIVECIAYPATSRGNPLYNGCNQPTTFCIATTMDYSVPFYGDNYANWLHTNGTSLAIKNISKGLTGVLGGVLGKSLISGSLSAVGGGALGGLAVATSALSDLAQTKTTLKNTPETEVSKLGNGFLNLITGNFGLHLQQVCCKNEVIKQVDDYFSMYGYKTNRLGKPSFNRPYYNYLKTIQCNLKGNMPDEGRQAIVDIVNNGITFWHDNATIGDYSVDNSP